MKIAMSIKHKNVAASVILGSVLIAGFSPANLVASELTASEMVEKLTSGNASRKTKSLVTKGESDVAITKMQVLTNADGAKNFVVVERVAEAPRVDLNVEFDHDSDKLRADAKSVLAELAKALSDANVRENCSSYAVNGHTDSTGTKDYNYDLSYRRAASVQNYLVSSHQIDVYLLEVYGFGEEAPTVANDTSANRQKNRRVEIECQ